MIRSFGDRATEALFWDEYVRQFQGFGRPAKRKLEAINAAVRLDDLKVPPANRLEKLKGNLKNFYSIRINDQWRVIFRWVNDPSNLLKVARRKLRYLNAAAELGDLRAPPGNRLEALKGDRAGQHSIRINDQFRICFVWTREGPTGVEITDYH